MNGQQILDATREYLAGMVDEQTEQLNTELARIQLVVSARDAEIVALKERIAELEEDPEPPTPIGVLWGMSAPADQWAARAAEVGPGLRSRRVFTGGMSPSDLRRKVGLAVADKLFPVVSFKTGSWPAVLAGEKDAAIDAMAEVLASFNVPMAVTSHHEPGDEDRSRLLGESGLGTLPQWARHVAYVAQRVRRIAPLVQVGPIDNGFKFSTRRGPAMGMTDLQLDVIYPDEVLAQYDFLAADCYHAGTFANPGANAVVKINGMSNFADRRGLDLPMGVGEYNGIGASDITAAQAAISADSRFAWACIFNSNENNREGVQWVLTGDRLAAFRSVLSS